LLGCRHVDSLFVGEISGPHHMDPLSERAHPGRSAFFFRLHTSVVHFFFGAVDDKRVCSARMASVPAKPRVNKLSLKRKRPAEADSTAAIQDLQLAAGGSVACSAQVASGLQCRRTDARTVLGAIDPCDAAAAAADSNVQYSKNHVAALTCAVSARSLSPAAPGAAAAAVQNSATCTAPARSFGPTAAAAAAAATPEPRPAQSPAALQEAELHSCFVCSANLQELSLLARQVHLNSCLDGTAASSSSSRSAHQETLTAAAATAVVTQQQSKAQRPAARCSIAGRSPKSVNQEELLLAKGLSASLTAALNGASSSSSTAPGRSGTGRARGSTGRGRGRSATVVPGELSNPFLQLCNCQHDAVASAVLLVSTNAI
jgi:hypothetical protein